MIVMTYIIVSVTETNDTNNIVERKDQHQKGSADVNQEPGDLAHTQRYCPLNKDG